jgi:hypothetical protein
MTKSDIKELGNIGALLECSENLEQHQNNYYTQTRCGFNKRIPIWKVLVPVSVVAITWLASLQQG